MNGGYGYEIKGEAHTVDSFRITAPRSKLEIQRFCLLLA